MSLLIVSISSPREWLLPVQFTVNIALIQCTLGLLYPWHWIQCILRLLYPCNWIQRTVGLLYQCNWIQCTVGLLYQCNWIQCMVGLLYQCQWIQCTGELLYQCNLIHCTVWLLYQCHWIQEMWQYSWKSRGPQCVMTWPQKSSVVSKIGKVSYRIRGWMTSSEKRKKHYQKCQNVLTPTIPQRTNSLGQGNFWSL